MVEIPHPAKLRRIWSHHQQIFDGSDRSIRRGRKPHAHRVPKVKDTGTHQPGAIVRSPSSSPAATRCWSEAPASAGIADRDFVKTGARILETPSMRSGARPEMIVKVKEPLAVEREKSGNHLLFAYLHLAPDSI